MKYVVIIELGDILESNYVLILIMIIEENNLCFVYVYNIVSNYFFDLVYINMFSLMFNLNDIVLLDWINYLCDICFDKYYVLFELFIRLEKYVSNNNSWIIIFCINWNIIILRKNRYSYKEFDELKFDFGKFNILLMGYSDELFKGGVIIVICNLIKGLVNNNINIYMLVNYFDNNKIKFYWVDKDGKSFYFEDRNDFFKYLFFISLVNLILFDIINIYCWYFGNDFIFFYFLSDLMKIEEFFNYFLMVCIVYIDYLDYSKDKRIINKGLVEELLKFGIKDFE